MLMSLLEWDRFSGVISIADIENEIPKLTSWYCNRSEAEEVLFERMKDRVEPFILEARDQLRAKLKSIEDAYEYGIASISGSIEIKNKALELLRDNSNIEEEASYIRQRHLAKALSMYDADTRKRICEEAEKYYAERKQLRERSQAS